MSQQSALQRTVFVIPDGAVGGGRGDERNLTPLQENSWKRISSVGKRGKGMAQLEGEVQTDLSSLPKSSAVPKDSQTAWTVNNPLTAALILLAQANPVTLWMGSDIWCLHMNGNDWRLVRECNASMSIEMLSGILSPKLANDKALLPPHAE